MLWAMTTDELDAMTKKLWEPAPGEDPYCCTATRRSIVDQIRTALGLPLLNPEVARNVANPVLEIFGR
jgi:hypothetical protein